MGMLRVAVSGLPGIFLTAELVAQLPPKEETRPPLPEGATPEPIVRGAPIDPKDFGGRRNWLARCKTVATAIGPEVVVFPHVLLAEASTYILYVRADPCRGPGALEGGEWLLELTGSGPIEAGADTMEDDLELLVRNSWVDPNADPAQPSRQERAKSSRERWLARKQVEEEGSTEVESSEAAAEREAVAAARERVRKKEHANDAIREFVKLHTDVEAVLNVEDPYIVAPDPLLYVPEDGSVDVNNIFSKSDPESLARRALGMLGSQAVLDEAVDASQIEWTEVDKAMEDAKTLNTAALAELAAWQEQHAEQQLKFLERREELKAQFQTRFEKQSQLQELISDAERADSALIKAKLDEAQEAGVATWDAPLIKKAELKIQFLQSFASLRSRVEDEPPTDTEGRQALAAVLHEVSKLCDGMLEHHMPISPEANLEELLAKAAELSKEPEVEEEEAPPA